MDSYIAVDLETTGLNPKTEKIIEIGALRVICGKEAAQFHQLVNPRRKLPPDIIKLTGITDEMVEECPGIEEIIEEFIQFCGDLPLLGHHVLFDYSFLKRAAVNQGILWEKDGIDTLTLCRAFMPEALSKTLGEACRFYHVETGTSHRAVSDANSAHLLYQAMKRTLGEEALEAASPKRLIYKVKKEQPASKRQKERLQELLKYHKIEAPVQIEYLTRNEASRLTDKILSEYRAYKRGEKP